MRRCVLAEVRAHARAYPAIPLVPQGVHQGVYTGTDARALPSGAAAAAVSRRYRSAASMGPAASLYYTNAPCHAACSAQNSTRDTWVLRVLLLACQQECYLDKNRESLYYVAKAIMKLQIMFGIFPHFRG